MSARWIVFVWCGLLAGMLISVGAAEAKAQVGNSSISNSTDALRVKAEWLPPNSAQGGYYPVFVELTSTRGPRELRVAIRGQGNPGSEVSQVVKLEANKAAQFTLAVPLTPNTLVSELRLYERGVELDKLRISLGSVSGWIRNEPPSVLLVSRVMPDWRLFEVAANNLLTGAGGTSFAHTQIAPDKLPRRWIDLSMLDLVLTSLADFEQMPATNRDALLSWTLTGGNLVVYGVATEQDQASLDRLLDLSNRAPAGASWHEPNKEDRGVAIPPATSGSSPAASGQSWHVAALGRLSRQGTEAYQAYCTDLLNTHGHNARSADEQNNLAWACVLGPDAVPDLSPVVKLAERAVVASGRNSLYLNTLGVALYRAGKYPEAIKVLNESVSRQGQGGLPEDWFFLAMANHRQGNEAEAKLWLNKAARRTESLGGSKPELDLFLLEAQALFNPPSKIDSTAESTQTQTDNKSGAAESANRASGSPSPQTSTTASLAEATGEAPFVIRSFGMGQVMRMAQPDPFPGTEEDWTWLFRTLGGSRLQWSVRHGMTARGGNLDFWRFMIEGVGRAPVNAFQVAVIIFTVVIGPLNYFVLRRRKQLYFLLITVPVMALVTACLLLGYVVASEGFAVRTRVRSVTWLNQVRGESVSWSRVSYYAGLAPTGGLRFSPDTAVYPIDPEDSTPSYRTLDWTEEQHLTSGWLTSRSPTQLLLVSYRQPGEQLVVATDSAAAVRVTNSLGTAIRRLVLRDADGNVYAGENLGRGTRELLQPIEPPAAVEALRELILSQRLDAPEELKSGTHTQGLFPLFSVPWRAQTITPDSATSLLEDTLRRLAGPNVAHAPKTASWLSPRTYVAIVEQPPLVELGVRDAVDSDSLYVIWGAY